MTRVGDPPQVPVDAIGTAVDFVMVVDAGGRVQRVHGPPSGSALAKLREGVSLARAPIEETSRTALVAGFERAREEGSATFDVELDMADGEGRHLHAVTMRKVDDQVICVLRDDDRIIDRRMGRDREVVRLASALGAYIWSANVSKDGAFGYRYYSSSVQQLTGYPPEHFEGGPERWIATVHPEDRPRIEDAAAAVLTQPIDRLVQEYRCVWPDGHVVWLRDHCFIDRLANGARRITGLVLDVTDRRRIESELLQLQKEESLGLLAGGIAHDFNNLLMTILRGAEHARKRSTDASAGKALDLVVDATRRATGLCQQLLAYAGRQSGSTEAVDMAALVSGMRPMLEALAPNARVEVKADGHSVVRADGTQLQQVLLNLVTNAVQALGESGRIGMRVWRQWIEVDRLPESFVREGATDGHYVMVEVGDDGVGMGERVRERMFDPFFTTKDSGHGLGLSATLGVVRAHAGMIQVDSMEGKGTTVTLALPAFDEIGPASGEEGEAPSNRRGRILFVDDEESLRTLTRMILEDEGFDVVTAANGAAALSYLEARGDTVDVVVLDLTMPGMKGVEVLERIRGARPALPVVLSSGYPPESIASLVEGDEFLTYLAKPYPTSKLLELLATFLGR